MPEVAAAALADADSELGSIERGGRGPDVYDHGLVAELGCRAGRLIRSRGLSAEPNTDR
jgi:hypothetical protein